MTTTNRFDLDSIDHSGGTVPTVCGFTVQTDPDCPVPDFEDIPCDFFGRVWRVNPRSRSF